MISEQELLARLAPLDIECLHHWIELGLVEPHREAGGYVFDEVDEARIALVCDLHYSMGLEHESLPVVLSLVDQLHQTRHSLRAITTAVSEQPDEIRVAITSRTRIVLSRGGPPGGR
jgi:chaperone modulatory protein CbpM